jgi:hypothetical protein
VCLNPCCDCQVLNSKFKNRNVDIYIHVCIHTHVYIHIHVYVCINVYVMYTCIQGERVKIR